MSWQHSGFNVHVCEPIAADDRNALECLAHYIIRCQFSQERMTYLEQSGSVNYRSKDGHTTKSFSALDWLALIISHIPRHGVIRKILGHLGLWDVPKRQPKRGREPPVVAEPALSVVEGEDALLVYADSQVIEYQEAYYIPEYLS